MLPWVTTLIQQGLQALPSVIEYGQKELEPLSDPYVDNQKFFTAGHDTWQRDAEDHRVYDAMNATQKLFVAQLQIADRLESYKKLKPKHQRVWSGAAEAKSKFKSEMDSPNPRLRQDFGEFGSPEWMIRLGHSALRDL